MSECMHEHKLWKQRSRRSESTWTGSVLCWVSLIVFFTASYPDNWERIRALPGVLSAPKSRIVLWVRP